MIKIEENYFIKDRHTFHMPIYTKWFVEYETVEELVTLLQSDLLREHTFFPIGGGSNLLFVKEMYNAYCCILPYRAWLCRRRPIPRCLWK